MMIHRSVCIGLLALVFTSPLAAASDAEPSPAGSSSKLLTEARLAAMTSRWSVSLKAYSRLLRQTPRSMEALFGRGLSYQGLGRTRQAKADFEKVVQTAPASALDGFYRGEAYFFLDQPEKTRSEYLAAIRLEPRDAYDFYRRGSIYNKLGEFDLAIKDLDQAARLGLPVYGVRGYSLVKLKEYRRAIADLDVVIGLNPEYAPYFVNRGTAHMALRNLAAARRDFAEAARLDPANFNPPVPGDPFISKTAKAGITAVRRH